MDATSQILYIFLVYTCVGASSNTKPDMSDRLVYGYEKAFDINDQVSRHRRADVSRINYMYNAARINPFKPEEKQDILDKHNEFRSNVDPSASNMEKMTWNDDLADLAGLWASVCYWGHGKTNHTDIINKFSSIGQNLGLSSGKPNGVSTVEAWHGEVSSYNYEDMSCSRTCGHYTQVVWANSKELGCARAYCAETINLDGTPDGRTDQFIFACHYSPAGNYRGQNPYMTGESCSNCQSESATCVDKLCSDTSKEPTKSTSAPAETPDSSSPDGPRATEKPCDGKVCDNGGTLSNCKCVCIPAYAGRVCKKLKRQLRNGVEVLLKGNIEKYQSYEMLIRESVAKVVTRYCNKNTKRCCAGELPDRSNKEKEQTYAYITYQDVITAMGYPEPHAIREGRFWTMVLTMVPKITDLCGDGALNANRRKRGIEVFYNRMKRNEEETEIYLDQEILLAVIQDNVEEISNDVGLPIEETRRGDDGTMQSNGLQPGGVAGIVIVVLIIVFTIVVIAVLILMKRRKEKNVPTKESHGNTNTQMTNNNPDKIKA